MSVTVQARLFVVLEDQPWCALLSATEREINSIHMGDEDFSLVEEQAGLYDFLRNSTGMVIGLRFSTFSNRAILLAAAKHTNMKVDYERQYLEVYVRGEPVIPGHAEQGFGDDSIWQNKAGTYAIMVATSDLTDGDIAYLHGLSGQK